MISPILAKIYGIILENKINILLENHGKGAKEQARFKIYHSTMDQLVTLRIIRDDCRNNKNNLLCCFVDCRKDFDIVLGTNLWNKLEEIKVLVKLRFVSITLYENVISKSRNTKGCLEEINYNIGVTHGYPLSHTLFGICINKLDGCSEEEGCISLTLSGIVIILLIYTYDNVLMEKNTYDLNK